MASEAIVSLKHEIEKYLIRHETLLHPSSRLILEFAYNEVESSQGIAKRMFGIAERSLAEQMKNAAYKLKISLAFPSSKHNDAEGVHNLEKEIHFFTARMKKLEEDYADELYKSFLEGEDRDEEVVSPDMVGLVDQLNELKEKLIVQGRSKLKILSLIGMQGIVETSLSQKVFDDPRIVEHFDYRVWVKIGRKCRLNEVASNILAQLSRECVCDEEDGDVVWCLNESLRGKRYLIVLDDVWDKYMAAYLQIPLYSQRGNELKNYFPEEENGSRVLLTSSMQQADEFNLRISGEMIEMRLMMNKEESWDLLCEKVFGEEPFCWELEVFLS